MAVPAIKRVINQYPDAQIHYLYDLHPGHAYITGKQVLEGGLPIDRFLSYAVYDRTGIRQILSYLIIFFKLRFSNYDLLVNLVQPPRSHQQITRDRFFFRLAGFRRQVVAVPSEDRGLSNEKRPLRAVVHESDYLLEKLAQAGFPASGTGQGDASMDVTPEEAAAADRWLSQQNLQGVQGLVAVAAGSKMEAKKWPEESFVQVLRDLWEKHSFWPVFLGGNEDKTPAENMINQIGAGSIAAGSFSIRGSLALLKKCDFYLGNDTGTMHLAVAAGLKCVALFSARDQPGRWYPYGKGHVVHRLQVDCEGCMLEECKVERKRCLTEIMPDAVLKGCEEMIQNLTQKLG